MENDFAKQVIQSFNQILDAYKTGKPNVKIFDENHHEISNIDRVDNQLLILSYIDSESTRIINYSKFDVTVE